MTVRKDPPELVTELDFLVVDDVVLQVVELYVFEGY